MSGVPTGTILTLPSGVTLPTGITLPPEYTTPGQPPQTTGPPAVETTPTEDCIYDVTADELDKDEPVQFADDITAQLTPEGAVEYNFPEPRTVSEITVQADKTGSDGLEVVFTLEDGTETSPQPLDSDKDEPTKNDLPDQPGVVKVTIKRADDKSLEADKIPFIEVVACKEGTTAGTPAVTGPPATIRTLPPGATFPTGMC